MIKPYLFVMLLAFMALISGTGFVVFIDYKFNLNNDINNIKATSLAASIILFMLAIYLSDCDD